MDPIVIIGTGLAGYGVAREVRKLDKAVPIVMVSRDEGGSYSKPMLSNAFAQGKEPPALLNGTASSMADQLGIEIRVGTGVGAIDTHRKQLVVEGKNLAYSHLVLAIGADPIRPDFPENVLNLVWSVNDLADYDRFRRGLAGKKRVAILGAGLIGCEFSNDLRHAGFDVVVIDPAPHALARFLPENAAKAVEQGLHGIGVDLRFNVKPEAVVPNGEACTVVLSNGEHLEADIVLSAIGLRPRTALAKSAGLAVNRGIVTNRFLEASAPDVFALGDCAEVDGLVLPFVMPIMNAARALAKTLTGVPTQVVYPAMPVVVKTPAVPVVVLPPMPGIAGEWRTETGDDGVCALFYDGQGTLRGFALVGAATAQKNALVKRVPAWIQGTEGIPA